MKVLPGMKIFVYCTSGGTSINVKSTFVGLHRCVGSLCAFAYLRTKVLSYNQNQGPHSRLPRNERSRGGSGLQVQ